MQTPDFFAAPEREISVAPQEKRPRQYAVEILRADDPKAAALNVPKEYRAWVRHYVREWRPLWRQGWRPRDDNNDG